MFWTVTQSLLTGLATTFEIFILTLIFALPLGLVLAFGLLSKFKPLQRLVQILVWITLWNASDASADPLFSMDRGSGFIQRSGAEMRADGLPQP